MNREDLEKQQNVFAYKSRIAKLQIGKIDLENNIKAIDQEIDTLNKKLKEIENGRL